MLTREQSIRATFDIFQPEGAIEVRAMSGKTFSGYYRDRDKLLKDLARRDDLTWYFVMNRVDDACFSRKQSDKIMQVTSQMKTTGDRDITAIRWVLIDADPVRAKAVSATDEEKAKAHGLCLAIYNYLNKQGFREPVVCDSGNGYHLLYAVKMEPSHSEDIKKFLQALDMLFSNESVEVDTSVFNPSRMTKVYGTVARKGANTPERPHRASGILRIPEKIEATSITKFKEIAAILPETETPTYRNGYTDGFDVDEFIRQHGIPVYRDIRVGGNRKILLERCPFDENHKAPDSAIFVSANGAVGFHCFHNSCRDKRWQDVRMLFDPACYKQQKEQTRRITPHTDPPTAKLTEQPGEASHFLRLCDIEVLDRSQIVSVKTGITDSVCSAAV